MKSRCDIVYFVKESAFNEELRYSLRSVERNFKYRNVWFCGGRPDYLRPDKLMRLNQVGLNKWEKVRNNIRLVCENEEISEDFWLFNDDFYIMKPQDNMKPQYNGKIIDYIEDIKRKNGGSDSQYTMRLRDTIKALKEAGLTTYNYEVHKPMLINRKKALELLDRFPTEPGFRSLYGNYFKVGGVDKQDMKVKLLLHSRLDIVDNEWEFLSTSDKSFAKGNIGCCIRDKFKERSRFEV